MNATFFKTPADFRKWLASNHTRKSELLVGFYKKSSGKPSITWEESVDQALCFGWIDGIRKSRDDVSYTIRFTPRKPKSNWSSVNIKRAHELSRLGLMQPAGIAAFQAHDPKHVRLASYEAERQKLDAASEKKFKSNKIAWEYFQSQAPSYLQVACHWVMSAKQQETKAKRLATLIQDSENHKRLAFTTKWSKK